MSMRCQAPVDPTLAGTGSTTSWTVVPPSWQTATPPANTDLVKLSSNSLTNVNGVKPGDPIAVRVSGNFKMMFPTLLYVSPTIPMNSMVILTCEGT